METTLGIAWKFEFFWALFIFLQENPFLKGDIELDESGSDLEDEQDMEEEDESDEQDMAEEDESDGDEEGEQSDQEVDEKEDFEGEEEVITLNPLCRAPHCSTVTIWIPD